MFDVQFSQKTVVVTGASYGLGRACAIAYSRLGANVVILARSEKGLAETNSMLQKPGLVLQVNLSHPEEIEKACAQIAQNYSCVDILINNAAGWFKGRIEETDAEIIEDNLLPTIMGSFLMTKYLLPSLKKSSNPHIVNVSSTAALPRSDASTIASSVIYHTAKWGQTGLSESMRTELKKEGIKVTTLFPGKIITESAIDDGPLEISKKFASHALGVKDVVESILFCTSRSHLACINSLVISEM